MRIFEPDKTIRTKYIFFTGKGGVGKTSAACASAVALADSGKSVMLISTDPASNLQDVFSMELTTKGFPFPVCRILSLLILTLLPLLRNTEKV